jgi:hypothetical protein
MEPIKDAFHRLIRFGHAAKERALPVWKSTQLRFEPALQWLRLRPRVVFWTGGIGIALAFLVFSGATAAGAALLAWAALRQAETASERHQAQTNADRQRRITESFAKAVEQLGSDKLEVRLGGIYSLERISKESPDDYWTVMENLTAFVRERSRRNEAERTALDLEQRISRRAYFLWLEAGRPDGRGDDFWSRAAKQEELGEPPAADIAAVLTVIMRRSEQSRKRERANNWRLDLSGAVLKQAGLIGAHLEGANLSEAHLEGAYLLNAHLEGADLSGAHLKGAFLVDAHLKEAFLIGVHLEGADLSEVWGLDESDLDVLGLAQRQLPHTHGDAETKLPEGMTRPAHWPEIGA